MILHTAALLLPNVVKLAVPYTRRKERSDTIDPITMFCKLKSLEVSFGANPASPLMNILKFARDTSLRSLTAADFLSRPEKPFLGLSSPLYHLTYLDIECTNPCIKEMQSLFANTVALKTLRLYLCHRLSAPSDPIEAAALIGVLEPLGPSLQHLYLNDSTYGDALKAIPPTRSIFDLLPGLHTAYVDAKLMCQSEWHVSPQLRSLELNAGGENPKNLIPWRMHSCNRCVIMH